MRRRPTFYRFSELTHANANRDFQIHTNWTDGEAPIEAVIARAREVGLAEIAFTEHARANSDYYLAFFEEVDRHAAEFDDLTVFRGFEVKVLDDAGRLDISDDMRVAADVVLGSVHSFPHPDGGVALAHKFPEHDARETEFALARGLIVNGTADVISHAGGMCLRSFGTFPVDYMAELVALAAQHGVAFEINTSYHGGILDALIPMLERHDPPVSIGSDVHRLDQLGSCRDTLREILGL